MLENHAEILCLSPNMSPKNICIADKVGIFVIFLFWYSFVLTTEAEKCFGSLSLDRAFESRKSNCSGRVVMADTD